MNTDIAGAARAGLDALFVTHGIHRAALHGETPTTPADPAELRRLYAEHALWPVAAIGAPPGPEVRSHSRRIDRRIRSTSRASDGRRGARPSVSASPDREPPMGSLRRHAEADIPDPLFRRPRGRHARDDQKTVENEDVIGFAELSGDHNPIHLSEHFARKTRFGGRIVHGLYTASLISAVIGMRLPGPGAVYISQTLNFLGPVMIGDVVDVSVEVLELTEKGRRVRLQCECRVGDKVVLEGEGVLSVPPAPKARHATRLTVSGARGSFPPAEASDAAEPEDRQDAMTQRLRARHGPDAPAARARRRRLRDRKFRRRPSRPSGGHRADLGAGQGAGRAERAADLRAASGRLFRRAAGRVPPDAAGDQGERSASASGFPASSC